MLNALRHQRTEHKAGSSVNHVTSIKCSTPCGINGRNTTSATAATATENPCAQRLAASTDGTHDSANITGAWEPCAQRLAASTDGTPPKRPRLVLGSRVLNALRHQRTEHTDIHRDVLQGLVVLNALRHQRTEHGIPHWPNWRRHPCAQRLAASTDGTPVGVVLRVRDVPVLNALRHQRTEHHLPGRYLQTLVLVLNALRHQRTEHPDAGHLGIAEPDVLNALRHQRTEHAMICRTLPTCDLVLNALRHQRTEHTD